jgi:hypothetical protein
MKSNGVIMKYSIACTLLALSQAFGVEGKKDKPIQTEPVSRVYVGGFGGYGAMNGMYNTDGQFSQFRLTLGVDAYQGEKWDFGFEGGVQSGNSSPVAWDTTNINNTGGLVPQVILKPLIDGLAFVRWNFTDKWCLLVKGGVAYRQMQFTDRTSSKDSVKTAAGEFQGGLGYQVTKHARIVGLYQGIYSSSNLGLGVDSSGSTTIQYIPTQQAGLFGVEYNF